MNDKKRDVFVSGKKNTSDIPYEKRRKLRRYKLMAALGILLILLAIVNSGVSVLLYTNTVKAKRTQLAAGIVKLAGTFIDTEKVDEYIAKGKDAPGYEETERILYNVRDDSVIIEYLYVLKIQEDG